MNRYPLWKYLLIITVVAVSTLYALPNLFPEDPAVQISQDSVDADEALVKRVENVLKQHKLEYKSAAIEAGRLLVRFAETETQLAAADRLKRSLGGDFTIALNLAPATPQWLRDLNAAPMYLGLDLRGGVHFLMEVDMQTAVEKTVERYKGEFRGVMRENKLRYLSVKAAGNGLEVGFKSATERDKAMTILRDEYRGDLDWTSRDDATRFFLIASISEDALLEIKKFAIDQNITTLRKRVNELGVAEPIIQRQGQERIVVQLPGVQDTARAKEILGATATLEFRLVNETDDPFAAQLEGRIPPGSRLYYERDGNPILLKRQVMLTGDYIVDAASGIDTQNGGPIVSITLDGKGARLFSKVTGENVKKLMAVVFIENKMETVEVNGELVTKKRRVEEVINVARIQEQLAKRFQISGLDSPREAHDLALLLRAGALAAPMQIVEERTIGPSLGQENIDKGFMSVVIGFVLVMIFMVVYYRVFGMIANVALMVNLVMIIAVLSLLQATLTLPGIAGIVLTVGMAVDANVLIFERIREELRNGMTPQAAITAGYDRALSTIADANITTLIAALVLFGFGTGPIKGFAITLSIGILSSMFTAIMGTRAIVNLYYGRQRRLKNLAI